MVRGTGAFKFVFLVSLRRSPEPAPTQTGFGAAVEIDPRLGGSGSGRPARALKPITTRWSLYCAAMLDDLGAGDRGFPGVSLHCHCCHCLLNCLLRCADLVPDHGQDELTPPQEASPPHPEGPTPPLG